MNEVIKNISRIELADIEGTTVRALNTLKYNGLKTLKKILLHYKENGDFKKLRNCGNKTNNELLDICLKYKNHLIIDKQEETKNELKEIIDNLNLRQRTIINSFVKSCVNNLSVSSYNVLEKLLNQTFTVNNVYHYIIAIKNFKFERIRNIGGKSVQELNQFKADILEYINLVCLFENENDLQIEYYYSQLNIYFPNIELHKLSNIFYNDKEIRIFSLIIQLLNNEQIFAKRELIIFKYTFNFFIDFKHNNLSTIASFIGLTTERIRQIRNTIYRKLNTTLKFILIFEIDFNSIYNINTDTDLISVKNEIVDSINKNENNKFNKLFITKIISIFFSQTHEIIGYEQDLLFGSKRRFVHEWKTTYLISKKLTSIFDFEKFTNDIFNRHNDRIINSYSFNFQGYLLKFYKPKDYSHLEEITIVCDQLLFDEFELILDLEENIIFQKNIHKSVHEYAYEILKEIQEPVSVKVIFQKIAEKYPNYECSQDSVRASMQKDKGFICFGRTSTYGLKIWEEKYSDIKGGTIKNMVMELLQNSTEPIHILDIEKHVKKYRDTEFNSIYRNIQIDKTDTFLILNQSYIGLIKNAETVDYLQFYNIPKFFGKSLKSFLRKNSDIPTNDIVKYFSEKYEIEERIVYKLIEFQIEMKYLKLENNSLTI